MRVGYCPSAHPGIRYLLARPSFMATLICPMAWVGTFGVKNLLRRNPRNILVDDWRAVPDPFVRDAFRWICDFDNVPWPPAVL